MNYIYIGVSSFYMWDREWLAKDVEEHMRLELEVDHVRFMFNAGAKVYDGDVYRITMNTEEGMLFFLLRNPHYIISKDKVEDYIAEKAIKHYY